MGLLSLLESKNRLLAEKNIMIKQGFSQNRIDEINYKIKNTDILIEREKQNTSKQNYSEVEKVAYYKMRVNDKTLSDKQRAYASNWLQNRLNTNAKNNPMW